MNLQGQNANVLLELKNASLRIRGNVSEESWHDLIQRYDMLFLGERFSTIGTVELAHTLVSKFSIDIDIETLNKLIPEICSSLGMTANPMIRLEDVGKPNAPISSRLCKNKKRPVHIGRGDETGERL